MQSANSGGNWNEAMTANWYDQWGNTQQCPICWTFYVPSTLPHVCNTFMPYYDWTPKLDPFVEFKKLYRKLVADAMSKELKGYLEGHFKDTIDKPAREELAEWIEGAAQMVIDDEPKVLQD